MTYKIVIPARLGSTRLPQKPLREIAGKPMIQWVYEAASRSTAEEVVVATDDIVIQRVVEGFAGRCCLTRADHPSGTDRLHEVAEQFAWSDDTILVNVQGDEPLIPAQVIDQVATNLANNTRASVATLSEPVLDIEQLMNPNVVKVVSDAEAFALYFSRAPVPFARDGFSEEPPQLPPYGLAQRHIGIYAYRVGLLNSFVTWPVAPLELTERLEQLRILVNGHKIHVQPACAEVPGGVDTEEDLRRVNEFLRL